jgi:tetratricopeptide (TPR) repeat protein
MKFSTVRTSRSLLLAAFLAAVLPIFWAAGAQAAEMRIRGELPNQLIEITGGKAARAWRLAYGTTPTWVEPPGPPSAAEWKQGVNFVEFPGNRAWFGHGQWLRLIDTEKGIVLGRWQFPEIIVGLQPVGSKVSVRIQGFLGGTGLIKRTLEFDPAAPQIPYWPIQRLGNAVLSIREIHNEFPLEHPMSWDWYGEKSTMTVEEAKALLPFTEEMARRDPAAPWFRVKQWRLMGIAGLPNADALLDQVLAAPNAEFNELLQISRYVESWGAPEYGQRFFERGYAAFLERGNDPRLFTALWGRLVTYSYYGRIESFSNAQRLRIMDNIYRLAPMGEATDLAWLGRAVAEEKAGNNEAAALWRQRAQNTAENGLYAADANERRLVDWLALVALGSASACIFFLLVMLARYRPQRRLDLATWERMGLRKPGLAAQWKTSFACLVLLFAVGSVVLYYAIPNFAPGGDRSVILVLFLMAVALSAILTAAFSVRRRAAERKRLGLPAFSFGFLEYWSLGERVAFLLIVLIGWLAAGVVRIPVSTMMAQYRVENVLGMGHLGSPLARDELLQLGRAPARDLFLAISYQQGGDSEDAEWLYRSIPRYPQSWNNLGVLLKERGKTQEAQQAFEHALRIEPGMPEALFNLGRGAEGEWAEVHVRYLPDRPMLATPTRAQLLEMLRGPSLTSLYLSILAGPLNGGLADGLKYLSMWVGWRRLIVQYLAQLALVPLLGLALAFLLVVPSRVPSAQPGGVETLLEVLLPGSARAWLPLGGVVLAAWCTCLAAGVFRLIIGTPFVMVYSSVPNLEYCFGIPREPYFPTVLNPSWWPVLIMFAALLFGLNLVVVIQGKRASKVPEAAEA